MKRFKIIVCFVLALFSLPFLLPRNLLMVKGNAEEVSIESGINESIQEQIDKLNLEELQAYIKDLGINDEKSLSERLFEYISGVEIEYQSLLQELTNVLFANCIKLLPAFVCIAAISIVCGIVNNLKSGLNKKSSSEMISLISYLGALVPLTSILIECIRLANGSVEQLQTQAQVLFPIMLTLMAASGQTATVAVCQPMVAFLSTTLLTVINQVVFPFTLTILAFSMANHLSSEVQLGKFSAFFKSVNKWIIGISISVFGLFFSVQGIVASSYDGIVKRVAKYAIGTGVPIVGGFLSSGFDLAVAGSILIKNSLGGLGIFLIVYVLFEPLSFLMATNIFLRLTSAITQPFGESKISDFLSQTADDLNYCTAGMLLAAFMYFICIIIGICSTEMLI